jgi:hypothetical protein
MNLKRVLVPGRDTRHQLSDSSPKEGLGLDLYGHKRHVRIHRFIFRQHILGDVGDRRPSKARVFEAASSCPD